MKAIVAISENWGIGKENSLLFHIPEDLKFFKAMTLNKIVVMGRKTLESLPGGKPLKERTTVVLSSSLQNCEGVIVAKDTEQLNKILSGFNTDDIMICGGEQIYKLMLPHCDTSYVTKIEKDAEADKFFPNLDSLAEWELKETSEEKEHNGVKFTFNTYKKRKCKSSPDCLYLSVEDVGPAR